MNNVEDLYGKRIIGKLFTECFNRELKNGFIVDNFGNKFFFYLDELDFYPDQEEQVRIVEFRVIPPKRSRHLPQAVAVRVVDGKGILPNSERLYKVWNKNAPYIMRNFALSPYAYNNEPVTITGYYGGPAYKNESHVYIKDILCPTPEGDKEIPIEHILLENHYRDYYEFWSRIPLNTALALYGIPYPYGDIKFSLRVDINNIWIKD